MRPVEEIRADLADCDRDGVPWPSAARRLLADLPALLDCLEAVKAWLAKAEPYPELNGNKFAEVRAALSVAPQPQPARGLHADGVDPTECDHGETKPHDFWPHDKPPRGRIVKPEWCPGPVAPQPATCGPAPSFPAGAQPESPASDEPARTPDLMVALRASLDAAKQRRIEAPVKR